MHGLINRSLQCFLSDTCGAECWAVLASEAGLPRDGFEALLIYDDALTDALLDAACIRLARAREALLEDLGTYIVSHPNLEAVRRLLRFGGDSFVAFLHSLEELPGRARLAVPELELPEMTLSDRGAGSYRLACRWRYPGSGHVMLGILRAMADDYGALAVLEHRGRPGPAPPRGGTATEIVAIRLLDARFAEGREFDLGGRAAQ